MTNLKCNVIHCSSNKDNCCCRPEIHVGGSDATDCCDTCCESFTSIPEGATNSVGYNNVNMSMPVSCEAKNCVYNQSGKCDADAITVDGTGACQCGQTECATFKCEC